MRKIILVVILILATAGTLISLNIDDTYCTWQTKLKKFNYRCELENFLKTRTNFYYRRLHAGFSSSFKSLQSLQGLKTFSAEGASYSKTNVQVEGVDEADIVKTDGEHIYLISENRVIIVKAYPPEEAKILSKITFNGNLKGLFITQNRLVVFEEEGTYSPYCNTSIKIYDVSDGKNPVLKRSYTMEGQYLTSRMIENYVYVIIGSPTHRGKNIVLPKIYSPADKKEIDISRTYYSTVPDANYQFTTVLSVNILDDYEEPKYQSFLIGTATTVYVSRNNIYLAVPQYCWLSYNRKEKTFIHRIELGENGEIEYKASGEVLGKVLNQFSMDEYAGYLRIATTTGDVARFAEAATAENHIYVLDMNLKIIGKLEGLAKGERIYSARFMGPRCYLVTFRKIDPFFVIDLENPTAPKVLGYLKIPGYSNYLHPYDENHIIGIGKDTVPAETGDFSWHQGVKISIFNVKNVRHPEEIAKYVIGDRGTGTPVLRDHKALLFDKSLNLMVLPVLVAQIDRTRYPGEVPPNAYGDYVWQGAYVFNVYPEEDGIIFRGRITHIEGEIHNYDSSPYVIKRALYIESVLYTISEGKILMNSLDDLSELGEIILLEEGVKP